MTYDSVLIISCIVIPYSWLFATIYKIWKECILGYILLTIFALVLLLRICGVAEEKYWHIIYLIMVCVISLAVILYSLYVRKKRIERTNNGII